jgi:plastocyanin
MTEFANAPQRVTIAVDDQVRCENDGAMDHNARSGTDPVEDGAWGSPDVAPGSSWSMTFTTPGT